MRKNAKDRYDTWIDFGKDLSKAFSALRLAGETISDSAKFTELRTLSFFEDFDDVTLWEALRISAWRNIPKGAVIIREGDSGESFYLLVEGEVDVSIHGTSINTVRRGGCFGELLYFSDKVAHRTTTITANTDITVVEIKTIALKVASSACQ
jgi:CRP-like cAMP-binding protein